MSPTKRPALAPTLEHALPMDPVLEGTHAEQLLADPTMSRMLELLEQRYVAAWKAAKTVEDREACHARLAVLADLLDEFRKVIDSGQYEQARRKARA